MTTIGEVQQHPMAAAAEGVFGGMMSQQELDRVTMPPPPTTTRSRRAQMRSPDAPPSSLPRVGGVNGDGSVKLDDSVLAPAYQLPAFPTSALTASTRLTSDAAPKPHFPSKALRRSPSSLASPLIEPDSPADVKDAPRLRMASFSSTHSFHPPPSLSIGNTHVTPAKSANDVDGLRTIAVPSLSPVHIHSAGSSPSDERIPGIATRSRSMHVPPTAAIATPATVPRPTHKLQRSLSTPGTLAKSATSSPPLNDSPSEKVRQGGGGLAHNRHPSNSTSSVGPNVAGRVGVGGNVMVDPHGGTGGKPGSSGAGAFVFKVYNMLLDPSFQHLISFNENGQSFTVCNVQEFSKNVLPKHFKHNNFSSFVRQLNMYGFHKVNKTPRGQRGQEASAAWEFIHPKFHRGRPDLLDQIRRKPMESETARKETTPLTTVSLQTSSSRAQPPFVPAAQGPALAGVQPPSMYHLPPDAVPYPPASVPPPPSPVKSTPARPHPITAATVPPPAPVSLPPGAIPLPHMIPQGGMPPLVHPPQGPPVVPIEAYHAMQNELLARLHAVHESHEALVRELVDSRRRQETLMAMSRAMYGSLHSLTQGNVPFPFPSHEMFDAGGGEIPPTFQITDHDPSQVMTVDPRTQQPVSVSASPANSEFGFHSSGGPPLPPPIDRRVSLDPSTYGALGGLALSSNPGTPALFGGENSGSPFTAEGLSPEAGPSLASATGNGWHLGNDGLLAPGPNTAPPLSPGTAFSTAIGTPLPPSPMPYQTGHYGQVGLGVELGHDQSTISHVDPSVFINESPMPNHFYDGPGGGHDRMGSAGGGFPLPPAPADNSGPSSRGSPARHAEELDIAGLLRTPGTAAYQAATGKGAKKRPATGSMDLNIQPSR